MRIECRLHRPNLATSSGSRNNFVNRQVVCVHGCLCMRHVACMIVCVHATCHLVSIQAWTQSRSHLLPESNVVGPVKIRSAVRLQGVKIRRWHVARAVDTYHVPLNLSCHFVSIQASTQSRSHYLLMSNVVGPVKIGSFIFGCRVPCTACHRHVPRGTKRIASDHMTWLSLVRAEQRRSKSAQPLQHKKQKSQNTCHVPRARAILHGMWCNRLGYLPAIELCWKTLSPSWSDQPFGRYERINEITWHVPLARAKGTPPSFSQWHLPTNGGYRPTKFGAESVHWFGLERWQNVFWKGLRGGAWHVPRGTDHSAIATIVFYRSGASNESSPVPIGAALRAPGAKMIGQIHRHTLTHSRIVL